MGKIMTSGQVTYNLMGTVRNMGLSVAGVTVRVWKSGFYDAENPSAAIAQHVTTHKGDFQFSLPPGKYIISIVPNPNTCYVPRVFPEIEVAGNFIVNIQLEVGVILSGLISTQPGIDLKNIEVVANGIEPTNFRVATKLDNQGRYNLVVPKGRYYLGILWDAPTLQNSALISSAVSKVEVEHDTTQPIDLVTLTTFVGQVVEPSGKPVPNAIVTITGHSPLNQQSKCITDLEGNFEFVAHPACYDLAIDPPEFAPLSRLQEDSISLEADLAKTFTLERGFHLTGTIKANDEPVADCTIEVRNCTKKLVATIKADETGHFGVGLAAGTYDIVVNAEGNSLAPAFSTVTINGDQSLSFDLEEGVRVKGFVRDQNDEPRPDVSVYVALTQPRMDLSCTTKADGSYEMVVPQGRHSIFLNDERDKAEAINAVSDDLTKDFVYQGACVVRLKVVSDDEEPIVGCHVSWGPYGHQEGQLGLFVVQESNLSKGATVTDEYGICQMTLSPGVYSLRFVPPADGSYDERTIRQLSIVGDLKRKVKLPYKNS